MQLGFAMLCAGSIREKNVKNVLLWNLLDSAGGAFGFWSIGYALAYGGDDPSSSQKTIAGNAGFFLSGDTDMEFWFFQYAFACALSSIVAGTIAERCQMAVSPLSYNFLQRSCLDELLHHMLHYDYNVSSLVVATAHLNLSLSLGVPLLQHLFMRNCLPHLCSCILVSQWISFGICCRTALGDRCD